MKRFAALIMSLMLCFAFSPAAFAAIDIIDDAPWDDEENQMPDNGVYYTHANDKEYVVLWATPECNVEDGYLIVPNGTELTVSCRVSYMEGTPWGKTSLPNGVDEEGLEIIFEGWVLMSELYDLEGNPVFVEETTEPEPSEEPLVTPTPVPSGEPDAPAATIVPERPKQAITVMNTYDEAIVYTCIAITVGALALVAYVLIKHKALNKKGE